jgi:c-di-GMP-binding flagellar brake protein YcgR
MAVHFDEIVTVGEIMEFQIGDLAVKTKLQDILENRLFTVFHPTLKGVPISLTRHEIVKIWFHRSNGIFSFEARINDWYIKNQLQLCELEAITEIAKFQRRKSFRLPIMLSVTLKRLDGDEEEQSKIYKARTVDISEDGMLLSCFQSFPSGTPVSAEIKLPDMQTRVFKTEVLRCEKPFIDNDPHNMVLLFLNCSQHDRTYLARFIMRQQIVARKRRGPGK